MQTFKKLNFLVSLVLFFTTSTPQHHPTFYCGNIQLQSSSFLTQNSTNSFILNRMIKCKSQKLYFRTSLGLFPISSIDYITKTLTVSHISCSSSEQYVSPAILSAGFPSPPHPNSLLLFNCSHKIRHPKSPLIRNCTLLHTCGKVPHNSCLLVQDIEKIDAGFHPKDLSCSGYRRVYRRSLSEEDDIRGVELGTRISFDIPDHVPDICNECAKPNGNCGVGLKCICHAKECSKYLIFSSFFYLIYVLVSKLMMFRLF